jgi:MinD-like ATPase involved in chromosome partitioning or flagellar assembly
VALNQDEERADPISVEQPRSGEAPGPGVGPPAQPIVDGATGFGEGSVRDQSLNGAPPSSPTPAPPPPSTNSGDAGLDPDSLLRSHRPVPKQGWRHLVFAVSRGRWNPGPSTAEVDHDALLAKVRTPVPRCVRVAIISLKGGVGKTTTTAGLGATLASIRGDRVVAVDANPDAGTLASRFPRETDATVRDILGRLDELGSYGAVRARTSQGPSRLEIIASDQDPAVSTAFSEDDYRQVSDLLARFYSVLLTDSGTGLLHSAMQGTLALADSLVIVTSPSVDGAKGANDTLDWLVAHGHTELVEQSIAVISTVRRQSRDVDIDKLEGHFAKRCREVVRIPYDPHLQTGSQIDLDQLRPPTRRAYLELAAHVAGEFSSYTDA